MEKESDPTLIADVKDTSHPEIVETDSEEEREISFMGLENLEDVEEIEF